MARRRFFDEATLTQLREMPASDALGLLAIHVKACDGEAPQAMCRSSRIAADRSRRWHVLTTRGEFEILTTGCQWYDMRGRCGGGGAIDLAMHVRGLSFVDAIKQLTRERSQHRSDHS